MGIFKADLSMSCYRIKNVRTFTDLYLSLRWLFDFILLCPLTYRLFVKKIFFNVRTFLDLFVSSMLGLFDFLMSILVMSLTRPVCL